MKLTAASDELDCLLFAVRVMVCDDDVRRIVAVGLLPAAAL